MRVILLQDIKNVGRRFEVKEVNDGYGRNFLLARKLAVLADEQGLHLKNQYDLAESKEKAEVQAVIDKLKKEVFRFDVKYGEKGGVFGSVTREDIQKVLKERGLQGDVILKKSIKSLGAHEVEISFGKGRKGVARVEVAPLRQ